MRELHKQGLVLDGPTRSGNGLLYRNAESALPWTYVYVVYRLDASDRAVASPTTDPNEQVTIKEVLSTREQAEAEVARLNRMSEGRSWRYYYQNARYYPQGRR